MTEYEQHRLDTVHKMLTEVMGGSDDHLYFEPPENLKLSYPCIVYERSNIHKTNADDIMYKRAYKYTVTVIDNDADSDLPDKVLELPYCSHDQHFISDRLSHNVFTLWTL